MIRGDLRSSQPAIMASHLGGGDGELTEAPGHAVCGARHPNLRIETANLANDPTLQRQLRPIEQRGRADAGSSGLRGRPELVDADADGRDDAQSRDDRLSLHRRALSPEALGRVSSRNPGIYVSR